MKKNGAKTARLERKKYEEELERLQAQLCVLQDWVKAKGLRVVIVFEGRDAAGKGGTIKAITERVSPRVFRVVALPAPSDREKSQMYMQRYLPYLPAAGEIVIFDRSWYNRAGVEHVMGFCSKQEYHRFLELCPAMEREMVRSGLLMCVASRLLVATSASMGVNSSALVSLTSVIETEGSAPNSCSNCSAVVAPAKPPPRITIRVLTTRGGGEG